MGYIRHMRMNFLPIKSKNEFNAHSPMDTELLPYRLKTARRKKSLRIKDLDKQLLKLDRERHDIGWGKHPVIMEALDKPYQKGWKRLFVLKKDVQKSDKAPFYQEILNKINQVQYHYDESFKRRKRKKHYARHNHEKLPELRRIDEYYWNTGRPGFTIEEKACFSCVEYWDPL
jgi:hypothetical protein